MKKLIKNILGKLDLTINKKSTLNKRLNESISLVDYQNDIEFVNYFSPIIGNKLLDLIKESKSEVRQDIFFLNQINFKRDGFFVDIGASDGITFSNTYLIEKNYGYKGILVEPSKFQAQNIEKIRKAKLIDKCVWSESGKILKFIDAGNLSTIKNFIKSDSFYKERINKKVFDVETISLTDLLDQSNAPSKIEYLSIDTEGSEFDILAAHDFSKYSFDVITCEHNFTDKRNKIYELLLSKNYERKFEKISRHDDWYVKKDISEGIMS